MSRPSSASDSKESRRSLPVRDRRRGTPLELDGVEVQRDRDGSCLVRVRLVGGEVGEATTLDTPPGLAQAGARAAVRAVAGSLADSERTLELRGTKEVRAFDARIIIAAVRIRSGSQKQDLIGAVEMPGKQVARGAAMAVLQALS